MQYFNSFSIRFKEIESAKGISWSERKWSELLASCQMSMVESRWGVKLFFFLALRKINRYVIIASAEVMQIFSEYKNDKGIQFLFNLWQWQTASHKRHTVKSLLQLAKRAGDGVLGGAIGSSQVTLCEEKCHAIVGLWNWNSLISFR